MLGSTSQRALISREVLRQIAEAGFRQFRTMLFLRARGEVTDVLSLSFANARRDRFVLVYGVDVPLFASIRGGNAQTPYGWLSEPLAGAQTYVCFTQEQIVGTAGAVLADLRREAYPWFDHFGTAKSVATAYRRKWLGGDDPDEPETRGKGNLGIVYGLMLRALGDLEEALPWLRAGIKDIEHANGCPSEFRLLAEAARAAMAEI